ncbi:hypothetical protein IHN63_01345 [Deinococcus sp. 6YEL10]|uniref:hypothetical protein n=1 Tax=Deinococcus sp. 6YEL10 TaxID=2745870 RepID=UPI001E54F192|nr:hypothetical protein [Deinococcus sp. 6YEL10]MCD0159942.1 hypothetical protein [Deinococcus sp. 6YEL10]
MTRQVGPRHRWTRPTLVLIFVTFPLWSASFWRTTTRAMDTRNEREACLAFIHARPGWTTATDLERRLDDLQLTADAEFTQDLQVAQAQLAAHAAPAGHIRLYGLPAHATQHWWFGRAQLPGRAFTLRAPDFQRVPGLSVLVLDLPWKGGAFLPVELMTPCGTYHQTVTLLLRTDDVGSVRIRTQEGRVQVSEQVIPVTRP